MEPTNEPLILRSPMSPDEWDAYFDLRWRILRQPWGQPRGSARDTMADSAFHLLLMDAAGKALACGPLHSTAPGEAQLRYMAVDEHARGCGYGGRILEALEAEARGRGARKIVLNARVIMLWHSTESAVTTSLVMPKRYLE